MTSEQQFETILAAIADLQVAVDALGLDVQRLLEVISAADSPQPPEWATGAFTGDALADAGGTEEDILRTDPPPSGARDDLGAVASYVVIAAALVVFGVVVVALLYIS